METNATQKNSVSGIDALNPSSREDFVEFEKLLREKITQYDKSIHYSTFLESLFRELCITCKYLGSLFKKSVCVYACICKLACVSACSRRELPCSRDDVLSEGFFPVFFLSLSLSSTVEVEDLRKISTSMTVLLNEKQKQEKVCSKGRGDFFTSFH